MASNITVDTIRNSSGNTVLMQDGAKQYSSGEIIQIQYTLNVTASTQTITANTDTAIDNMTVNITPKFSDSIIKLDRSKLG